MSPYGFYMATKIAQDSDSSFTSTAVEDAVRNLGTGLMTNTRGGGPVSVLGGSVGGVIDGVFARPLIHGALGFVEHGLERLAGSGSDARASI